MRHIKYLATGLVVLLVVVVAALSFFALATAVLWIIIHATWLVAGAGLLTVAYLLGRDFSWGNE